MKRMLAVLLTALMLLTLGACKKEDSQQPNPGSTVYNSGNSVDNNPVTVQPIAGYTIFESTADGIRFQYPETWLAMDADAISRNPEMMAQMMQLTGMTEEEILVLLEIVVTYIYNTDDVEGSVTPNLSLNTMPATGFSAESFVSAETVSSLKAVYEPQYVQMFESFSWGDVEVRTYGNYTGIYFSYTGDTKEATFTGYQYMVASGDLIYSFTYTAGASGAPDELIENIFSSVEFI